MSDYRRWISYIYAYENGVKKRNAGYAKLELKDGNLTMTLHVTPDSREGKYRVCLYKNQPGHREGVLLGEIEKKCGGDCARFTENAADLSGSGLLFQEMNGLLLYDERGKCLLSSWEDTPVEMSAVQEVIALLERQKKTEEQVLSPVQESAQDVGVSAEESVKEPEDLSEVSQVSSFTQPICAANSTNAGTLAASDGRCMSSSVKEPEDLSVTASAEPPADEPEKTEGAVEESAGEEREQGQAALRATGETVHMERKKEDRIQKPGRLESRIFSCLPAMYPFEHQEFERSVRMEPQDIGLLPREMWKYAGNSFLLHSYYAYHHILFARKVRKEQRNCYLMLPGVYEPKEQHMAQLFGFSRFCPVRKKALQQGDFGYWYMEVGFSGDAPEVSAESGCSASECESEENISSESRE